MQSIGDSEHLINTGSLLSSTRLAYLPRITNKQSKAVIATRIMVYQNGLLIIVQNKLTRS